MLAHVAARLVLRLTARGTQRHGPEVNVAVVLLQLARAGGDERTRAARAAGAASTRKATGGRRGAEYQGDRGRAGDVFAAMFLERGAACVGDVEPGFGLL